MNKYYKKHISTKNKSHHEKTKKHLNNYKIFKGGDFQTLFSKLPEFPWAKYKGEKHLPGHNYTGRLGLSVF